MSGNKVKIEEYQGLRASAIEQSRGYLRTANSEGRILTAEERESKSRADADVLRYGELIEQLRDEASLDATLSEERDAEKRAEQRDEEARAEGRKAFSAPGPQTSGFEGADKRSGYSTKSGMKITWTAR